MFDGFDLDDVIRRIASHSRLEAQRVRAAIELLESGNTIPFIARYRKEATQGLDELNLRTIEDALKRERELAQRKTTILKTIHQQGQLTDELRKRIESCFDSKTLEDLYLPFRPKRQTRATIARERGLQPLAELLLSQKTQNKSIHEILRPYVDLSKDVPDEEAALQGACDIVAEIWSEEPATRRWLVKLATDMGFIASTVKRGKKEAGAKFEMYFDFSEAVKRIPSHRFLAMRRGEEEGFLNVALRIDDEESVNSLRRQLVTNPKFEFHRVLWDTVADCYQRLLHPATESAILQDLKQRADEEAIAVFAKNLRELLLAPPAGPLPTIGIDPGFRTGCKLAVVDGTGKYLTHSTIYPTPPGNDVAGATKTLESFIKKYDIKLIAIGNGTASRETDAFVSGVLKSGNPLVTKVMVNESGASIYSASELAGREYPELDLTVRGAISIAHRLQDPLAELVKIDPKSIGVGQYQHDVNQTQLKECLDREVESCVNAVGVDVNMASVALLSYVAGIGPKLAERIVEHRDTHGPFSNRQQLCQVPKLGPKAFEQAAGFLRIRNGSQSLDNSAVHPESYFVVEQMAKRLNTTTQQLVGNEALTKQLNPGDFVSDRCGLPTVQDILNELAKPGRDPRSEFRVAHFTDGVNELKDLRAGMVLEGIITNVTRFGAFVDIGVHHDALIHISQLANQFIRDPSEVVSVGDVVKVKVLEVDVERQRVSVSRKQV